MNGNLPDSWDQALIRSTPTKVAAPSYTYVVKKDTYEVVFYWSALKMTKHQTLRKFWHFLNFFLTLELFLWDLWDLLCNMTLSLL